MISVNLNYNWLMKAYCINGVSSHLCRLKEKKMLHVFKFKLINSPYLYMQSFRVTGTESVLCSAQTAVSFSLLCVCVLDSSGVYLCQWRKNKEL